MRSSNFWDAIHTMLCFNTKTDKISKSTKPDVIYCTMCNNQRLVTHLPDRADSKSTHAVLEREACDENILPCWWYSVDSHLCKGCACFALRNESSLSLSQLKRSNAMRFFEMCVEPFYKREIKHWQESGLLNAIPLSVISGCLLVSSNPSVYFQAVSETLKLSAFENQHISEVIETYKWLNTVSLAPTRATLVVQKMNEIAIDGAKIELVLFLANILVEYFDEMPTKSILQCLAKIKKIKMPKEIKIKVMKDLYSKIPVEYANNLTIENIKDNIGTVLSSTLNEYGYKILIAENANEFSDKERAMNTAEEIVEYGTLECWNNFISHYSKLGGTDSSTLKEFKNRISTRYTQEKEDYDGLMDITLDDLTNEMKKGMRIKTTNRFKEEYTLVSYRTLINKCWQHEFVDYMKYAKNKPVNNN